MNTQDIIIIIVLVAILIPATRSAYTHMKGEGSCCGGPKEKPRKKKIAGTPVKSFQVSIDGMMCDNCRIRIENRLNELSDVVAKVNLKKGCATVKLYSDIDENIIKTTIENLDYKVTKIEQL